MGGSAGRDAWGTAEVRYTETSFFCPKYGLSSFSDLLCEVAEQQLLTSRKYSSASKG